jgi:hypothetical protein
MTTRVPFSLRPCRTSLALAALLAAASSSEARGQLIQIKTLPVADGQQWQLFPSANRGMGGLSIALRDSLLDPFENPAKGSRLSDKSHGFFFGSPSFYAVSKNAGGGRTLPLGGIARFGSTFGGVVFAVQQIDDARQNAGVLPPTVDLVPNGSSVAPPAPTNTTRRNQFAFATLGRVFERVGISVGANAMWSGLNHIDGVDLLYAGSRGINQHGGAVNARLGMLKEWSGERALEATVLHDRFRMTHDVTWADNFWDPNARTFVQRGRVEVNRDHTNIWGLHLGYTQPIANSDWRVGTILTTNLSSHPHLPEYQIAQVMTIPWDPGRSAAYDIGIGLAKTRGPTRFGVDAIFEPIRSHTWGETPDSMMTAFGTRPAGSKTTENWFRFTNAILRTGIAHDVAMDSLRVSLRGLRFEGGLALRSIGYKLSQRDHVAQTDRKQNEGWMEWTRTWGLGIRFTDLEVRYTGRTTTGTGRPGISNGGDSILRGDVAASSSILSAPNGPIRLTGVAVTTHQLSVSLPIR